MPHDIDPYKPGVAHLYSGAGNRVALIEHPLSYKTNRLLPLIKEHDLDQIMLYTHHGPETHVSIINKDLSSATQCGNGLRALAHMLQYPRHSFIIDSNRYTAWQEGGETWVNMGALKHPIEQQLIDNTAGQIVHLGNPHCIFLNTEKNPKDLVEQINQSSQFPNGINISFATIRAPGEMIIQTFERGAGWTQACASAACAASIAASEQSDSTHWSAIFPGGIVRTQVTTQGVFQTGPVELLGMARI